jgi:tRNA pseudouridine38-40 synthase
MTIATIECTGEYVRFDFSATAFLHHMVRNIVGALIHVGVGKRPVEWIGELLLARDRRLEAPTFTADGLYLTGVDYEPIWQLPPSRRPLDFPKAGAMDASFR